MKGLALACLSLFATFYLAAQQPDTTRTDTLHTKIPLVYHGINAGVSADHFLHRYFVFDPTVYAPTLGYYLDINLKGRGWLFMQFNLNTYYQQSEHLHTTPQETEKHGEKNFYFDLDIPFRFALRTGKENASFSIYPTIGLGLYFPLYYYEINYVDGERQGVDKGYPDDWPFYPYINAGVELKWKFNKKHHVGAGINVCYMLLTGDNVIPSYGTAYLKFGWNKYKK